MSSRSTVRNGRLSREGDTLPCGQCLPFVPGTYQWAAKPDKKLDVFPNARWRVPFQVKRLSFGIISQFNPHGDPFFQQILGNRAFLKMVKGVECRQSMFFQQRSELGNDVQSSMIPDDWREGFRASSWRVRGALGHRSGENRRYCTGPMSRSNNRESEEGSQGRQSESCVD